MMTIKAKAPSPSLAATVDGSELLGSNTCVQTAAAMVVIDPTIANQYNPIVAPKNGAVVAADFLSAKRVKSAPAVTQAKLKAAKTSKAFPNGKWAADGAVQVIIFDKGTSCNTTTVSQITSKMTNTIPTRSIKRTERCPNEIEIKCNTPITATPMSIPFNPPGLKCAVPNMLLSK